MCSPVFSLIQILIEVLLVKCISLTYASIFAAITPVCRIVTKLSIIFNKANLRDLIAAIGLVILSNWIQIVNFSARVTLKFDGWPRKSIGHLFYTTSSFVHHFKSMGEFKLELQSGNAQFGSKLAIFFPCDLEIWWMTLENNGAHPLYYIKLCA